MTHVPPSLPHAVSARLTEFYGDPLPDSWRQLSLEAQSRLRRLAEASPLYARVLQRQPARALWLEQERNLKADFRYQALLDEWTSHAAENATGPLDDEGVLERLRTWRRLMSLRIAYRSVNGLASEQTTVEELSRVAEFAVRECLALAEKRWQARYGTPWDDSLDRPARFCVLALGKLGGQELNFSSDVDVLFAYDGDGYCRRDGAPSAYATVEFFTKVAETLTSNLSRQTEAGFLFRVDARLRPEGAAGPLVRSLTSLENYYALAGQTWERLALLKARPIAGAIAVGSELLESLQSFRYPRHPPPSLLSEVAGMKARTEREIVGAEALARDVKSGAGGIREIEFIVQALQLLNAGRYPFLQTHSTQAALEQLARYDLMDAAEVLLLQESYWFLRKVEHRLQMRDEHQTHTLPTDPIVLAEIAHSLGYESVDAFAGALAETQQKVRGLYSALFPSREAEDETFNAWWTFFTSRKIPPVIQKQLEDWFGPSPEAADEFRLFACGDASRMITREQVGKFQHLSASFDALMPKLARPLVTLKRLVRFAERYASRSHFFDSCANNPEFLHVLAVLFDRSTFIHELLCAHPEIFDEVLRPEILRQRKNIDTVRHELRDGPRDAEAFAPWLRLYVRAEQVRHASGEVVGVFSTEEVETSLTVLVDAVLHELVSRDERLRALAIVALGKYGSRELIFGSDLDLLFFSAETDVPEIEPALRSAVALLRGSPGLDPIFAVDLRLRPHGEAGPFLTTPEAFRRYHQGQAQTWERQALTRARVVCGPASLVDTWNALQTELLYSAPLTSAERAAIWSMRLRVEAERDVVEPAERAFKTGRGGVMDHEFFAQAQQLLWGASHPSLRSASTRDVLQRLLAENLIPAAAGQTLLQNYDFLKRLEIALRRDENRPVSVLPTDVTLLARWLGYTEAEQFMQHYRRQRAETRDLVEKLLFAT